MICEELYKTLEETNRKRVLENTLDYLNNYLHPDVLKNFREKS